MVHVFAVMIVVLTFIACPTFAADKPNIILIVSDDFGYGDAGVYGGGPGRGMPTPNIDRLAGLFAPSLPRNLSYSGNARINAGVAPTPRHPANGTW